MKKLELIIFDMDGVLIDTEKFYMKSEYQIIKSFGKEVELDYFSRFCGTTQDNIWGNLKKDFDLPQSLEELKVIAKKQLLHLFETEKVELIPNIAESLAELKSAGYTLAVASSTENAIVIEDSTNGIQAAKNAEMLCVAYNNPAYHAVDQTKADVIISDMTYLTSELLENLFDK
ncbi:MAG: HAD family phosphatase [Vagococcus sp.]|uniref:HAD family hydrolase n=1 Tax=Vagococcus sp. TaxID=1933889 RepID=UPI002FCA1E2A